MNSKTIKINDEEFPESILNAPKIKFLRPQKESNFKLLLDEEDSLSDKKDFERNFQTNAANGKDDNSKVAKRPIIEFMKKIPSNPAQDSNSYSRYDSGEFCRNEKEKVIFFPDFKL